MKGIDIGEEDLPSQPSIIPYVLLSLKAWITFYFYGKSWFYEAAVLLFPLIIPDGYTNKL